VFRFSHSRRFKNTNREELLVNTRLVFAATDSPFAITGEQLECEMNAGFHPDQVGADRGGRSSEAAIPVATLDQWKQVPATH
jgi:hypothetical protein